MYKFVTVSKHCLTLPLVLLINVALLVLWLRIFLENLRSYPSPFSRNYVKIDQFPKEDVNKFVGERVEFYCEASGSPPPLIQWYKENTRLTEVRYYIFLMPSIVIPVSQHFFVVLNFEVTFKNKERIITTI